MQHIIEIIIPYWFNRKIEFHFYWLVSSDNANRKDLKLTIWDIHKLPKGTYEYNEDEWVSNWWKHFRLWRKI
jgi:hypothetical protein